MKTLDVGPRREQLLSHMISGNRHTDAVTAGQILFWRLYPPSRSFAEPSPSTCDLSSSIFQSHTCPLTVGLTRSHSSTKLCCGSLCKRISQAHMPKISQISTTSVSLPRSVQLKKYNFSNIIGTFCVLTLLQILPFHPRSNHHP